MDATNIFHRLCPEWQDEIIHYYIHKVADDYHIFRICKKKNGLTLDHTFVLTQEVAELFETPKNRRHVEAILESQEAEAIAEMVIHLDTVYDGSLLSAESYEANDLAQAEKQMNKIIERFKNWRKVRM